MVELTMIILSVLSQEDLPSCYCLPIMFHKFKQPTFLQIFIRENTSTANIKGAKSRILFAGYSKFVLACSETSVTLHMIPRTYHIIQKHRIDFIAQRESLIAINYSADWVHKSYVRLAAIICNFHRYFFCAEQNFGDFDLYFRTLMYVPYTSLFQNGKFEAIFLLY